MKPVAHPDVMFGMPTSLRAIARCRPPPSQARHPSSHERTTDALVFFLHVFPFHHSLCFACLLCKFGACT